MATNGLEDLLLIGKNVTKENAMTTGCDEQMALLAVNGTAEEINALYDHVQSCHLEAQDAKTLRMYKEITRSALSCLMKRFSPPLRDPEKITKRISKEFFELFQAYRGELYVNHSELYDFVDKYGAGGLLITKWTKQHVRELQRIGWEL